MRKVNTMIVCKIPFDETKVGIDGKSLLHRKIFIVQRNFEKLNL